jgi:hypothetical protein
MASRDKNKHSSRHRTHKVKPASLPRISLAKRAPVAEAAPAAKAAEASAATAEAPKAPARKTTKKAAPEAE